MLETGQTGAAAENSTLNLAESLVSAGKRVVVAARLGRPEVDHKGIEVWDLGHDYNISAILKRMRKQGPYVLVSVGPALPLFESRAFEECRHRILICQASDPSEYGVRPEIVAEVADKIVCLAEAKQRFFLEAGAPSKRLELVSCENASEHLSLQESERVAAAVVKACEPERSAASAEITLVEKPLRVLMQNRSNTFTQRGGDTVVIEKTAAALRKRGVQVTIDLENSANPKDFEIVHLFNFVLSSLLRSQGERAFQAGVPFVVTTLYEDVNLFHNQSQVAAQFLMEYVGRGQDRQWYAANRPDLSSVQGCGGFDNAWTVDHAAALLTNGASESAALRRDYGSRARIREVPLGCDLGVEGYAQNFTATFGVEDFVLCVGRIESRKNQLMLLKALEDSELPLVLAAGGFTYQPEYDRAVRQFKRKGRTLVVGRLSEEMLAAAYRAARVHVLPSWYELPGLVSLEAALYGCQVVTTRQGTAPDYFGSEAYYCNPADEASILNAVTTAYQAPVRPGLKEVAMRYNWEQAGQQTYNAYREVIAGNKQSAPEKVIDVSFQRPTAEEPSVSTSPGGYDLDASATKFQEVLEQGEMAARRKEYNLAHEWLERAERMMPCSVRALRARGAVFFAENNVSKAKAYFERAHALDASDARTLSGLGMCEMHDGAAERAYVLFVAALEKDSEHLVTLLQLIECAYKLGRFEDVSRILTQYVDKHPENLDMKYCLAGALYKQGCVEQAEELAEEILKTDPNHLAAKQLINALKESKEVAASPAPSMGSPTPSQTSRGTAPQQSKTQCFDALDRRLAELEEEKRNRKFSSVESGVKDILNQVTARKEQVQHARLLLAECEMLQGRMPEASIIIEDILRQDPTCTRALCGKGALAAAAHKLDQAKECFLEANRLDPDYDVPLAGLGLCAGWNRNHEEAWQYYRAALDRNPENVRALLGLIEVGYPLRRLEEVERALRAYLEYHPIDLELLYSLAGCCFAQNKLQEALEEVGKITLFVPDHEKALELKGMIEERLTASRSAPI
ncbi:MAG: tetratricopeptide repeat protein [Deltaproteobacteria bacterium]|nr:tetratricopeptide repeat protein [Deltaproteobacteria bacterium]